ncbi:MAG: tetratricopeptide repeat protein [Cyanobacteria bacterium P01_H01_bin.58]
MGMGRFGASKALAVLLGTGLLLGGEEPGMGQVRLAQTEAASEVEPIEPFTIEGTLDVNSEVLEQDGTYYNVHTFEGQAGQAVEIQLMSDEFDTYLLLQSPEGTLLSQNDDGPEGTNSRIVVFLPITGTYTILANTYAAGETGQYTVTWQPAIAPTATDQSKTEALVRALNLIEEARQFYQAGRYDKAEIRFRQALTIRRQQLGNDHPDVAQSLFTLAVVSWIQGDYSEAESLTLEALAIRRQQLGNNHLDVATHLHFLADVYQAQLRYDEAEILYEESLRVRRLQLDDGHLTIASSLDALAELYRTQGRYKESEPLYQEALRIRRQQLGNDHLTVAISLNNLAVFYNLQGRYGEAEYLHQEALRIRRQQLGNDHFVVAASFNNLGDLYRTQGRYDEAEPLLQRALMIRRQTFGNNHPDVALSFQNLALLYADQGRYDEAEPLYQSSLAIYRQQLGSNHSRLAASLHGLASIYLAQRRYEEAEAHFQQSLSVYRQQLEDNHPNIATNLGSLAFLYWLQGRYGDAETLYQESLAIRREVFGDRHPDIATSLNNLAALYQAQGNFTQAISSLQDGLDIQESNLDLNLATLTDSQRQDYAATISGTTHRAISLHIQAASDSVMAAQLALTTLLRRKGRVLDAGTSNLQILRQNLTSEDQYTLDQLTDTQRQLANLTFSPPKNLTPEQYRTRVEELEAEANQLESTLASIATTFHIENQPIGIPAVIAQVPTNSVLVEYVRYHPFNAIMPRNLWRTPRYAAYLLFPDGRIEAVDLGDAAEIDAAVQSFVGLLQDRAAEFQRSAGARPTIRTDAVEQVTGDIKKLVFDPIAPYLQDTDHLLISPDGQLNLLPFEALQTEAGGEYLVQQYQISYLNSGRDLLKFDVVEPSRNPAVIVANPDYEVADGTVVAQGRSTGDNRRSTELSELQVGPLPGTAAEAAAIRPLLPNADIRTEDEATENLIKSVQAPRILHIATHGFFLADVERPEPSTLGSGLIASDNSFGSAFTPGIVTENPLLRSGLALAGFNTRSSGSEDGVLTALEASQLNLFGTQLVVLSACDTGLGDIANGEGVYGLRRAFAIAGAETQLLSLWQVSDFGTQSLMARYYENLTAGMGRSEALREVQLEMIAEGGQYSHPYYWAAFILAGDWRSLD